MAIVVLAALASIAGCAQAEEESGEETLTEHSTRFINFDFDEGTILRVEYEVEVVAGPNVQVYFAPRAGYEEAIGFSGEISTYYEQWSTLDTSYTRREFRLNEHGTYFLIIRGPVEEGQVSVVMYTLDYGPDRTLAYLLLSILTVTLVGLPLLIYFLYLRKHSCAGPPPPTSGVPVRTTEGQQPATPSDSQNGDRGTKEEPPRSIGRG